MTPNDDRLALRFDLERSSPFFFKCQRCGVCCSNKAIKIGPYEILRLSRNLGITTGELPDAYLENQAFIIRRKPDGDCIFLAAHGCLVHPDRPLVCRLFPLGLLWDAEGKERLGNMPPHPDCLGYWSDEGTVEAYLETQDVRFYFAYENAYLDIIR
jgi:Fe-S-cluster containining protein